jgi:hypothetical protein
VWMISGLILSSSKARAPGRTIGRSRDARTRSRPLVWWVLKNRIVPSGSGRLYLAVIELIRGLYLNKLRSPAEYAEDTSEALVQFCGRFMKLLLWTAASVACWCGDDDHSALFEFEYSLLSKWA